MSEGISELAIGIHSLDHYSNKESFLIACSLSWIMSNPSELHELIEKYKESKEYQELHVYDSE